MMGEVRKGMLNVGGKDRGEELHLICQGKYDFKAINNSGHNHFASIHDLAGTLLELS